MSFTSPHCKQTTWAGGCQQLTTQGRPPAAVQPDKATPAAADDGADAGAANNLHCQQQLPPLQLCMVLLLCLAAVLGCLMHPTPR